MKFDPKITFRDVLLTGTMLVAVSAAWFALRGDVADAGEAAARAQKLSTQNTQQISTLEAIVNELVTAIKVEHETVKLKLGYLKERMGGFERRLYRGDE